MYPWAPQWAYCSRRSTRSAGLFLVVALALAANYSTTVHHASLRRRSDGFTAGEHVVNPRLAAEALVKRDPLPEQEREILRLAEGGASSGAIATLLRGHRRAIAQL